MRDGEERQPHASLDQNSRIKKAAKIERLLSKVCCVPGSRVLEVGTGSGIIAGHFSTVVGEQGSVHAVDVVDQRQIRTGFNFQLVANTSLPFDDDEFDICISNHVIEHVGDRWDQEQHLNELRRILKPEGWLYLAVPNRWTLVEPHFRLPFLSWLPRRLRDPYVKFAGRGTRYDCDPPSHSELESLFAQTHFSHKEVTLDGIKVVAEFEFEPGLRQQLLFSSHLWAPFLHGILPSYLYLAQPRVST
ncbi:MAG: methyltransferase domain-containing protein [Chromatiaceae bacterium]|nr:methyltransferase domain-containing protein [Chromatiaceae bacterium]MCP5435513.1 methyltransferase domain-containing protein [Chromatiaceae bacterium]